MRTIRTSHAATAGAGSMSSSSSTTTERTSTGGLLRQPHESSFVINKSDRNTHHQHVARGNGGRGQHEQREHHDRANKHRRAAAPTKRIELTTECRSIGGPLRLPHESRGCLRARQWLREQIRERA